MTFEFENLGPIKKASLELGKLTVICGKNNTGKTYLSYAVWEIIRTYENNIYSSIYTNSKYVNKEIKENRILYVDVLDIKQ